MKRITAILLSLAMLFAVAACGNTNNSANTSGTDDAGATNNSGSNSDNLAVADDDKVYIGVVTHMTGTNAFLGEYQQTINDAWSDYINNNGGILGKNVEFVPFSNVSYNLCVFCRILSSDSRPVIQPLLGNLPENKKAGQPITGLPSSFVFMLLCYSFSQQGLRKY